MKDDKTPATPAAPLRKPSDNLCKALAEKYPEHYLKWLFGDVAGPLEVVKTELPREPVRADAAMLVAGGDTLFHIEFQTTAQSETPLPLRMLDYYVGFKRRHPGKRIRQALVVLKDNGEAIAERYAEDAVTCAYTVVKLWERNAQELLKYDGLTPLAVLCHPANGGENLLRAVAEEITRQPNLELRREMLNASQVFAGLRYNTGLIRQILRRTDMLEESVIVQEFIQMGVQKGVTKGESKMLLLILKHRFGALPARLQKHVAELPVNALEDLGRAMLNFQSKADLTNWLKKHGGKGLAR